MSEILNITSEPVIITCTQVKFEDGELVETIISINKIEYIDVGGLFIDISVTTIKQVNKRNGMILIDLT